MRWTALAALLLPASSPAQDSTRAPAGDSSAATMLPPVEIAVTRDPRAAPLTVPLAISVGRRSPADARGAIQDVLAGMPGLYVASRNNPTQDPRIVIRGAGARTAFGVRGVRVLHDGIPLTLADGQTPVDYLDAQSVAGIEVIRGSASSLYGNAGGGVVSFSSPSLDIDRREVEILAGPDKLLRSGLAGTGGSGGVRYGASLNHTSDGGFREHARQRATRASARLRHSRGASSTTAHLLGFDMPLAENPGALTAAQLATDRAMAEPLAVARNAGKRVRQGQAAITHTRRLETGDLSATLFAGRRTLDNPLTFAIIDLDRASGGLLLRASRAVSAAARMTAGVDVQRQDDDRHEYENCHGATTPSARCPALSEARGSIRRAQRERVASVGPYVSGDVALTRTLRLSAGVRGDAVAFDVRDRLVTDTDPDESGRRAMRAVSPHVGVLAAVGTGAALYANVSSAFETPTATELGNKPDGSAGVNHTLEPQRARTFEVGAKGRAGRVRYELAAFSTAVRDELVSFETAGGAGRRFFRNAGRTSRRGVEAAVAGEMGAFELRSAATFTDFEFVEFETAAGDFAGKAIPGVPAGFGEVSAAWAAGSIQLEASGRFVSSIFVDDGNTLRAPGYEVMTLRGRSSVRIGRATIAPSVAIENVFGRRYVGAVSVNAAGGRYFEPAPGRAFVTAVAVLF